MNPLLRIALLLLTALLAAAAMTRAEEEPVTRHAGPPAEGAYRLQTVTAGIEYPVDISHAVDGSGRLFLLEQTGRIRVLRAGQLQPAPFLDLRPLVSQDVRRGFSERGLLGLAFPPDFAAGGRFFVHYSDRSGTTVLAAYQVDAANPERGDPDSREILLTVAQPFANHNGGQLAFGPDGYLYMGLGDGGSAGDPHNNGQNPQSLPGAILRLDVSGARGYAIPPDNPARTRNLLLAPEIWAWGLRNPWKFSFDRASGDLYIADVGQNRLEEVNFQPAGSPGGENYGWRLYEGSRPYSGERAPRGLVAPVIEYGRDVGCSITGGYVYRGQALPGLRGYYIFGDWCTGTLLAAWRDADGAWRWREFLDTGGARISAFGEDEAGELYIADYRGSVLRLVGA